LFRSNAFQTEKSELLFVVTARLAKTAETALALPTDSFKPPSRAEFMLDGLMESPPAASIDQPSQPQSEAAPDTPLKP
jgi:pilus assembly protein CpaC